MQSPVEDTVPRQYTRRKPVSIRPIASVIGPSIAYVPLTQGQWSLIDAEDAALVGRWNWYALWSKETESFYALRNVPVSPGKQTLLSMHVFLVAPSTPYVDHKNGVSLDNRRSCNLREATYSQNSSNCRKSVANTSGFKGVSWNKQKLKWRAFIQVNHKGIHLGYFSSPEEAHRAYIAAGDKYHGDFSRVA